MNTIELINHVFNFYHKTFLESKKANEYLKSIDITSSQIFKKIKLGFSDGTLIKTLSNEHKTQLKEIGILNKSGKEHFNNCIVFPLFDENNYIIDLCGFSITNSQYLFLNSELKGLFYPPKGSTTIILIEGIINALILMNAGYQNVLTIYNMNDLSPEYFTHIQSQRIKEVLLCPDNNNTRKKSISAITKKLNTLGINVRPIIIPDGNGISDYFRKHTKEEFNALLTKTKTNSKTVISEKIKQTETDGGWLFHFGEREYRVLGLNLHGLDRMKVNLKLTEGKLFHIDTLDLFHSRAREAFIKTAHKITHAKESGLYKEINQLIDLLEKKRIELQNRKEEETRKEMTPQEKKEALRFLKSKSILKEILKDFNACGCIGEESTKLFGYISTISRFMDKPLGILIVARSGAGKSKLQETICSFVPPEHLQRYTRITGQSLFYKKANELKYKVLSIAEEAGAEDAIYSIRTLQSDQYLTVAVTITDPKTGKKCTNEYTVEGPVVIIITTTNPDAFDFETRNRFIILTVDESRIQTRRILEQQRAEDSIDGLIQSKTIDHILNKHHNAQRLLKPLKVVNPFYKQLTYPDNRLLMRRDHQRYLTLIKTIGFLHQYQRDTKTIQTQDSETISYIEVIPEDIQLANKLAGEIMGRSLDELSPHTRSLLDKIKEMTDKQSKERNQIKENPDKDEENGRIKLTRRDICDYTGWSYWQVQEHLKQLIDMEYLTVRKGGKDNLYHYELVWDGAGRDGSKFIIGLQDVNKLNQAEA